MSILVAFAAETGDGIGQQLTGMAFSPVPIDTLDWATWAVRVEYSSGPVGEQRFAVRNLGRCLSWAGEWDEEPTSSGRTQDWLAAHRFTYAEAVSLARQVCRSVTWNGLTAVEVAARHTPGRRA